MSPPPPIPPPNEKKLRFASFAIHVTRGLLRDQAARRKVMFVTVLVAVVMLFCGSTFLASALDPHTRPGWFIFYWLVCAWVTMTVVLLAVFDFLLVRTKGRSAKRDLAQRLSQQQHSSDNAD
jgi:protein-S-isoprenylcysteine O-methyltransferase Ste14